MLRQRGKRFDKIFAMLKTYSRLEGERLRQSSLVVTIGFDVWKHVVVYGHVPVHYDGVLLCSCGRVWDIFGMFRPAQPNVYFPEESSDE